MESRPQYTPRYLISLLLLTACFFPTIASAQDFLCDATQPSTNQLPVLDSRCPIGQGLWGDKKPKQTHSHFWIQCGLLRETLSVDAAKPLYKKIATDVWLKPESKGTRCLIGPYTEYKHAYEDLLRVRQLPAYKKAFIRDVKKTGTMPATKKVTTSTHHKRMRFLAEEPIKPKRVVIERRQPAKPRKTVNVDIRRRTQVGKLEYVVPYVSEKEAQFYMENNQPWIRLDYESAERMCSKIKMRLATTEEWQALLAANVMEKNAWPMNLPYWGWHKKGLFTNGNTNTLQGGALLNVICVGKH